MCVLCFHTQICGEPVSELARGHGRERRSARASASLCACFADVGVGRGGGEMGGGLVAVDVQMCIMLKGCEWGGVT